MRDRLWIAMLVLFAACSSRGGTKTAPLPEPEPPPTTAPATYAVGDVVFGQWTDDQWYPGKIGAINADGTYRVDYDDGDVSPSLPASKVKVLQVDAAMRARVIDGVAAKLVELYVYPDVAARMAEALRAHSKDGAYETVDDSIAFAALLTEHLRAVSHDRHLRVMAVPVVLPEGPPPEPSDEDKARYREHLDKINCGFEKAERLDGGIGYLKFNFFGDVEICGPKATAAFAAIGDVDALIVDMRENGGGHPAMVAFVSSYLFAKRTHLNDIYDRAKDKTTEHWTNPDVPGAKLAEQPVYVLTSNRTFSGAEEFSYNLKNLKRATIVGETTGGGAHPTTMARVDDHFLVGVPFARAINPITKTNWEGTGVEPDVKVTADQALDTAKTLAAEKLAKQRSRKR
jgi:retinol-binding protein 3